ncbi:MAG TPA: alpha/beta hydrolase [Fredinandcohnia sp.]|nr:alpha/beta hydrolase [Fredinandcohnia sp.]
MALSYTPLRIPIDGAAIRGDLLAPPRPRGLVLFAHGSGSSRRSVRNRHVAERLAERGLWALLLDLLTEEEILEDARTEAYRYDVRLLAERVVAAIDWAAREHPERAVGLYGSSTGAAAALLAAAARPDRVGALVSRGGRPDLVGDALGRVVAPTLALVGSEDPVVLELNRDSLPRLAGPCRIEVIPGAGHLFEEPGALDRVANAAADWFLQHLAAWQDRPAPA